MGSRYGVRWIHAYVTDDAPAAPAPPPQPSDSPNYPVEAAQKRIIDGNTTFFDAMVTIVGMPITGLGTAGQR